MFAGRSSSLSAQVVAEVREALFAKRLKPGDFLGTEKDIAERFNASRIVARDALRTLEALGIVEIRMGKGGGARIARGNPRLFAEALAVQLDLTGVSAAEIMDAQRAIETLAAELAAENATPADVMKLRRLLAEAEAVIGDLDEFTRLSRDFHLAVAEASHNRVIMVQLISLEHVSWPRRNVTATPKLARHILDIHTKLADLIELRDPSGARALMDDHVKMIRARRVAERGRIPRTTLQLLNAAPIPEETHGKVSDRTAFPPAGMGGRGEGLFPRRGSRLRIPRDGARHRRQDPRQRQQGRRLSVVRGRPQVERELRLPLDRQRRGLERPRQHVHRRLFGGAGRHLRAANSKIKTPADLAGVPISVGYQSGSHYATVQALEAYLKPDEIKLNLRRRHAVRRMEKLFDGTAPAVNLFSGPYYFAEQLGFRKVIDTTFMIGTMIHGDPDPEDLRKFFRALRKAQRDIDLRPELYTHYYKNEFPDRFHAQMDTRRWGPGERLVFEPYTKEVFEESFEWIADHHIFPEGTMGAGRYEQATLSLMG